MKKIHTHTCTFLLYYIHYHVCIYICAHVPASCTRVNCAVHIFTSPIVRDPSSTSFNGDNSGGNTCAHTFRCNVLQRRDPSSRFVGKTRFKNRSPWCTKRLSLITFDISLMKNASLCFPLAKVTERNNTKAITSADVKRICLTHPSPSLAVRAERSE